MSGFRLVERDYLILREIERWRVVTGKHICALAEFTGQRACDRRLHKLIEADYIGRKRILYGFPGIYYLTNSGRNLISTSAKKESIKVEQIAHDIAVLDTAIYFNRKYGIDFSDIITEKQLHKQNGFGIRTHQPDFIFSYKNKTYCVEVELTLKSKDRFSNNIISNFTNYHKQFWIVPNTSSKIATFLLSMNENYPNIKIIEISEVQKNEYN